MRKAFYTKLINSVLTAVTVVLGLPSCKSERIGNIECVYAGPNVNYYETLSPKEKEQLHIDSMALEEQQTEKMEK